MDLGIKLGFELHIPLHDQIVERIRGLLATGELEAGERLPAARELASILGVHFATVASAYRRLDVEGLLSTQQGRETYILSGGKQVQTEKAKEGRLSRLAMAYQRKWLD